MPWATGNLLEQLEDEEAERIGKMFQRRLIWVLSLDGVIHGHATLETNLDDKEGVLSDGRKWWAWDKLKL